MGSARRLLAPLPLALLLVLVMAPAGYAAQPDCDASTPASTANTADPTAGSTVSGNMETAITTVETAEIVTGQDVGASQTLKENAGCQDRAPYVPPPVPSAAPEELPAEELPSTDASVDTSSPSSPSTASVPVNSGTATSAVGGLSASTSSSPGAATSASSSGRPSSPAGTVSGAASPAAASVPAAGSSSPRAAAAPGSSSSPAGPQSTATTIQPVADAVANSVADNGWGLGWPLAMVALVLVVSTGAGLAYDRLRGRRPGVS